MAHYHCCTQHNARNFSAKAGDELAGPGPVDLAAHILQNHIRDMLERNVQILADLRIACHLLQHILRKAVRVRVVDTNPFDLLYLGQPLYEFSQSTPAIEVKTVIGSILGNQHQFLDSSCCKLTRLLDQLFHRDGTVASADIRDGAIGAVPVAALGNLEICRTRAAVGRDAELLQAPVRGNLKPLEYGVEVASPEPGVHLRDKLRHFLGVALTQAAEDGYLPHQALLFEFNRSQNGIYAFLLGVTDEAAGIHQKHIRRLRRVLRQNDKPAAQLGDEMFGIHSVFRAAEG